MRDAFIWKGGKVRRKLFTLASLLSLLLFAATVVLRVRGRSTDRENHLSGMGCIEAGDGYLIYSHWVRRSRPAASSNHFGILYEFTPLVEPSFRDPSPLVGVELSVLVPLWMVATGTLILPISRIGYAILPLRAKLANHCPTCRYDLTGNTSGVCPECGAAIK
jgi:hypothetical protein